VTGIEVFGFVNLVLAVAFVGAVGLSVIGSILHPKGKPEEEEGA